MSRRSAWGLLLLVTACHAKLGDGAADAKNPDGIDIDGPGEAGPDGPLGPWGPAAKITSAASAALQEDDCTMSSNQLELYFAVVDAATMTKDLYVATRNSKSADFGPATPVGFNAAGVTDETPRLSDDDLTLYFGSARGGNEDIWFVHRNTVGGTWSPPQLVAGVNSTTVDKWFMPCGNQYMLVSNRGGLLTTQLFAGTMGNAPTQVTELTLTTSETGTFLTPDCLTIFFASNNDLYTSTRPSVTGKWGTPTVVTDFGTAASEQDPWMSNDQRTFIFASNAAGTNDIYISTR
jgi:hypothetical protein